jgi:DNA modification methylase
VYAVLISLMIYHGRQAARQFPPQLARDIYRQYSKRGARVLDPCAGWGGRLLGWHCTQHGGEYHGFDASAETAAAHARMIAELRIANARVEHAAFEDTQLEPAAYDFAFTSPPYFDIERYSDDPEQSCVRYKDYARWCDGFLAALIVKCLAALRPGAALALNVSDAGKHSIAADAQRIATANGASVERAESIDVGNGSHGGMNTAVSIREDIVVIRKR